MIQIRAGTFESNSSSSHSLIITTGNDRVTEEEWQKLKYDFWMSDDGTTFQIDDEDDIDFGRYPFQILTELTEKIRYAIASSKSKLLPEIIQICKKHFPNLEQFSLPIENWSGKTFYGSTDDSILEPALKKYNITLEEFLENKNYFIICDGDGYCSLNKLLSTGVVDKTKIIQDSCAEEIEESRNNSLNKEET